MTEQSQTSTFHSSSFLQGPNADYIEQLHARFVDNPDSVDASWRAFFDGLDEAASDVIEAAAGPSWARSDWPPAPNDELTAALDGQWAVDPEKHVGEKLRAKAAQTGTTVTEAQIKQAVLDSVRALMIIRAYRIRGHLAADLDPLRLHDPEPHPELDPKSYGFTEADMDRPIFLDNVLGLQTATLRTVIEIVKRTYCGTFALQFMHISDPEQAAWLKERIEGYGKEICFTQRGRRAILDSLVEAEGFEKFLQVKYTGHQALRPRRRRGADPGDGADHQARRRARRRGDRHRHAASRTPLGARQRDAQALPRDLQRVPGRQLQA